MIHLLGAITLCLVSVQALTKGKKIWVEQQNGPRTMKMQLVGRGVAVAFALIGVACAFWAGEESNLFLKYVGAL